MTIRNANGKWQDFRQPPRQPRQPIPVEAVERRDKRKVPKLSAPDGSRAGRCIQVHLEPDDYRKFYDVVMTYGTSGTEAVRRMIRQEHEALKGDESDG